MKKILLCTSVFKNVANGPSRFANLFFDSSASQNYFEPHVLTEDHDNSKNPKHLHKINSIFLSKYNVFSILFKNFIYWWEIKKIKKSHKIDAVLFNNASHGILSSALLDVKSFGFINDNESIDANFFPIKLQRKYFRRAYLKILEIISTKKVNYIVTNSDYLKNLVVNKYNLDSSRVIRLYKSVDIEYLSKFRWNNHYKSGPICITFIKNDYIRGGLFDLIDACKLIEEHSFKINVIGPDWNRKKSILNYSKVSNIDISFFGHLNQDEIVRILLKSNIFCTPSLREALGVSNIESLSIGIPIISTNVGGIPEVLNYGKNGYLVNPNNPHELADRILECISNDNLLKIKNGLKYSKLFSKEIMFENIYRMINNYS